MTKVTLEKAVIETEEGWSIQGMKQRQNLTVLHSESPGIGANSSYAEPPSSQKLMLVFRYILVQNGQALLDRRGEWFCFSKALPASRTASVMASRGTVPRHCHTILSQSIPEATCFSTWLTLMRVPRNVG
jgi:hypothetical protein